MYGKKANKIKKKTGTKTDDKERDCMRFHDILIRRIANFYYIEIRDATNGHRLNEAILPDLDAVKRFLDGAMNVMEIKEDATEKGQIEENGK